VLPLITAALLILNSCGSEAIKLSESAPDAEWCAPVLDDQGRVVFASCDWFLESHPETLNPAQWEQKQKSWNVTQCTPSTNMTAIKIFIEDTCSQVQCPDAVKQAFLEHFNRIGSLGTTDDQAVIAIMRGRK